MIFDPKQIVDTINLLVKDTERISQNISAFSPDYHALESEEVQSFLNSNPKMGREVDIGSNYLPMIIEEITGIALDPKIYRDSDAFFGISLAHKYFSKKVLRHFIAYGNNTFRTFNVLLMDVPHVFNYIMFSPDLDLESLDISKILKTPLAKESLAKTKRISDETMVALNRAKNDVIQKDPVKSSGNNIRLISFVELLQDNSFLELTQGIYKYAGDNVEFCRDLYNLIVHSIGGLIDMRLKHTKNISSENLAKFKMGLMNYIILELASLIYLTEISLYRIELDPTREFLTKKNMYDGKYPDLWEKLKIKNPSRGHINTHPKGLLKKSY